MWQSSLILALIKSASGDTPQLDTVSSEYFLSVLLEYFVINVIYSLTISLAITYAVDNDTLYMIIIVWMSSGVVLVMVATIMVVWLEVNYLCVCLCLCLSPSVSICLSVYMCSMQYIL